MLGFITGVKGHVENVIKGLGERGLKVSKIS